MDRVLQDLFNKRRSDPKNHLISALVMVEESGERLSPDELLDTVFLLLVAGHETTFNMLNSPGETTQHSLANTRALTHLPVLL